MELNIQYCIDFKGSTRVIFIYNTSFNKQRETMKKNIIVSKNYEKLLKTTKHNNKIIKNNEEQRNHQKITKKYENN